MNNSCRKWAAVAVLAMFAVVMAQPAWTAAERHLLSGSPSVPAINDTITNLAAIVDNGGIKWTAESTGVFTCGGYSEILIYMRVIPAGGDTTNLARFALAFKAISGDTNRVYSDSMAGVFTPLRIASAVAAPDSVAGTYTSYLPPAGTGSGAFQGEWVEVFAPWVGRGTLKSNQSYGFTTRVIPLSSVAGATWGAGRGQIRVRCIGYNNASVTQKAKVQLWVEGIN